MIIAYDTVVVQQMPRGNIELVEPRAMLLSELGQGLEWLFHFSKIKVLVSNGYKKK